MSRRSAAKRSEHGLRLVRWVVLGCCVLLAVLSLLRSPHSAREGDYCAPVVKARSGLRGEAAREWDRRSALYSRMLHNVARDGVTLVSRAGGTQGLSVREMFSVNQDGGELVPRLKLLSVPVRAIVIPLPPAAATAASRLAHATRSALLPILGGASVWLQDPDALHMSLFHASHHMDGEVPATPAEVDAEVDIVRRIIGSSCAIRAILERVLVTRGGVVMAVWNVLTGAQPSMIRSQLRAALPTAPTQLVSDMPILHMTLARIVAVDDTHALMSAVDEINQSLCGMQITFDTVWFAEEKHALALAMRGEYKVMKLPFKTCVNGRELDQSK